MSDTKTPSASSTPAANPNSPSDEELRGRVAANVGRLREAKGMLKADLAKAAGVDRIRINKIEAGQISPGGALLLRLARALDVSAEELAGEKGIGQREQGTGHREHGATKKKRNKQPSE